MEKVLKIKISSNVTNEVLAMFFCTGENMPTGWEWFANLVLGMWEAEAPYR